VNPHRHDVYTRYGAGVDDDMAIREVGIAPRPLQRPHPPLYGGFTNSMRTALFWARYAGKPIVLASDLEFCAALWSKYRDEAARWGHDVTPGEEAGWGGLAVVAPTDELAKQWAEDMLWFWDTWSTPFGQGRPELLIGSPDTISRRIEAAATTFPLEDVFFLIPQGIHHPHQVHTALELLATDVLPRFS
jgi:alkanesulfonate monooxygenase SsuD/methylene tetrahydromethanopterin reductase-like flavin-dependent oxidoreductase (luciferase family)